MGKLTNEQAKQEAIRKIVDDYYDNYPLIKPYVQSNGYFPITNGYISNLDENVREFYKSLDGIDYLQAEDHEEYNSHFRPKDLSLLIHAVETNHLWIRIEPDGSNLPESGRYKVADINNTEINSTFSCKFVKNAFNAGIITHYKPIEQEPLPIW